MERTVIIICAVASVFFRVGAQTNCNVSSVMLSHNGTTPVIGDTMTYTFDCSVTVNCSPNEEELLTVTFDTEGAPVSGGTVFQYNVMGDNDYSATLTLTTPIEVSHGQLFNCTATFNGSSSSVEDSEPFNVMLPTPAVTAMGSTSVQLTTASVNCTISNIIPPSNINVTWTSDGLYNLPNSTIPADMTTITDMNNIDMISIVDAGVYSCSAVASYTGTNAMYVFDSSVSNSEDAIVNVKLQDPTVTVDNAIARLNDVATLTCTIGILNDNPQLVEPTVTWMPNNGDMSLSDLMGTNFSSTYDVNVSSIILTGEYNCSVTIAANNDNTRILPSTGSDVGTVYATELTLTASSAIRLDVSPYNSFTTECVLSYYPEAAADDAGVTVTFSLLSNNTLSNISDLSKDVNYPRREMRSVTISGADTNSTEQHEYSCMTNTTINNVGTVIDEESVIVTVRGPALPVTPELLPPAIMSTSVTINWKVARVSYTPETFIITYGKNDDDTQISISGGMSLGGGDESFLTSINAVYQQEITDLSTVTRYWYQINSTNTFGSVVTEIANFTTNEAAPTPPTMVRLTIPTATTLTLEWMVPEMTNGDIIFYDYTCSSTNLITPQTLENNNVPPTVRSVILENLTPFIEYECNITASTTAGSSAPGTATGVTAQAAPDGPPTNFAVTANNDNPNQLTLSWMPPAVEERNGIIIRYYYSCSSDDDDTTAVQSTTELTVTVGGLQPFTNYTCNVRPATVAGNGTVTASYMATTAEDAPSMVRNLASVGQSDSAFYISWIEPNVLNGIISHYIVKILNYADSSTIIEETTLMKYITINSDLLGKGVPYYITVSAVTGGGGGSASQIVNFTMQGVPKQVEDVITERINATAARVSWTPLTLVEAQGFFDYSVQLTPSGGSRKRQAIVQTFPSGASSGIVTGLSSGVSYSVTVFVINDAEMSTSNSTMLNPEQIDKAFPITVVVVIVVIGLLLVLILTVVCILLVIFLRRMGTTKEAEIHENPIVLDSKRETDNGNELKLLSVKQDPEFNQRMQPVAIEGFADHVRGLHMNRDLGFEEEYESLKGIPVGSYKIAKLQQNIPRNRFDNVYSYDDSRVVLSTDDGGSEYINASFINGYKKPNAYIAAQGPLSYTVVDFWRMIWEFQLPTVVMLTELVERGIEKCTCYYPRSNNETIDVGGGFKVTLIEQQQFVEYKYKKFLLLNTNSDGGRLDVTHYHFLAWPDHGVPADKTVMMAFARRVRQTHPPEGPPLIVHCSAGVGRTGTFIVLDTMMQSIEMKEGSLNIYELVADMRSRRTLMVQTLAQYIYTHDALSEYIICGDTSMTTKGLRDRMNSLGKVSGGVSGYEKQLKLLDEISRSPSEGHCSDSLSKQNTVKNRYSQVISSLPYNETRVRLRTTSGSGDYINASIVDGYKHRGAFLATQVPLESTAADLWRMVWEQWSASIVMLCSVNEEENMHCYWPKAIDEKRVFGMIEVKLVSEVEEKDFNVRKFELSQESNYVNLATGNADKLTVTQYEYYKWPIDGKPAKGASLLELLNQLLKTQKLSGNKAITVMCNNGIDRTGAFICLYSQLERVKVEGVADVFQFVKASRFHRPGLVQSLDKYIFCHEILLEFLNSFDQYENFK